MREVLGQEARWSHSATTGSTLRCWPTPTEHDYRRRGAGTSLALPGVKYFDNKLRTVRRHKPREERMPKTQLLCLMVVVFILHTWLPTPLKAHVPYTQQGVASWYG